MQISETSSCLGQKIPAGESHPDSLILAEIAVTFKKRTLCSIFKYMKIIYCM